MSTPTTTPTTTPTATPTLGEQAYQRLRRKIVRLDLAPGDVLREDDLRAELGIGRTPIREALQRLAREHFVTVIPRRGMYVSGIDVSELSMLFETRTVLEPYAARLAAARGTRDHWDAMADTLEDTHAASTATRARNRESDNTESDNTESDNTESDNTESDNTALMAIDRRCHELMWEAAGNRFLLDTLDMLYAQSERLWHLYLGDVADMGQAVAEHRAILEALRARDGEEAAALVESHVRAFDAQIRAAVTERLASPLAG